MKTKEEIQEFFLEEYRKNRFGADGSFMQGQIYNMHLGEGEYDILAKQVLPELVEKGMFTFNNDTFAITEKGYDFIYNSSNKPKLDYIKVVPENMDVSSNEAFNTMWTWIGEENAKIYLSGPQLYKIMLSVDKNLPPSYTLYMDELREKRESTTRIDWVYDFWKRTSKDQKEKFLKLVELKINQKISEQEDTQGSVDNSGDVTDMFTPSTSHIDNPIVPPIEKETTQQEEKLPSVFISYSWDSKEHKEWVKKLADELTHKGIMVHFDQYDIKLGVHIPNYIEDCINKVDRILLIGTPSFKEKAEKKEGGVGYEYSIINTNIMQDVSSERFIPILRSGLWTDSFPPLLSGVDGVDMTKEDEFNMKLEDLSLEIYGQSKIKRPPLGKRPDFE